MARITKKTKEEWKVEKNVFSMSSERNLFKLSSQGHFEELESPIKIGKEANIFTARTRQGTRIIVKIYRLENCNFNTMYSYIRPDPRYTQLKKGKRNIIFSWVQREYRNLLKAREVIRVPTPLAYRDNILLMEFIGNTIPAPTIKDSMPKKISEQKKIFKKIIDTIEQLYKAGLVHGDLSEYNILNDNKEPVFIDFSQSTTKDNPNAQEIYIRDIGNVCRFFKRFFPIDEEKIHSRLIKE